MNKAIVSCKMQSLIKFDGVLIKPSCNSCFFNFKANQLAMKSTSKQLPINFVVRLKVHIQSELQLVHHNAWKVISLSAQSAG